MANEKLSVCCVEGHLMTEANTYRATIGGYPRRFCRTCKTARKAGDRRDARAYAKRDAKRRAEAAALIKIRRIFKKESKFPIPRLADSLLPARMTFSDGRQETSVAYLARIEATIASLEGVTTPTPTSPTELVTDDEARKYSTPVHANRKGCFGPLCNVYTQRYYYSTEGPSGVTCLLCLKRLRKLTHDEVQAYFADLTSCTLGVTA